MTVSGASPDTVAFPKASRGLSRRARYKRCGRRKQIKPDIAVTKQTLDPRNGTWLDLDLRLVGAEGAALLSSVLAELKAFEALEKARRADHQANHERRVECLLANAMRVHFFRESDRVCYNTSNDAYRGERWHSAASLRETVKLMASAGMFNRQDGVRAYNREDKYAATFWQAQQLQELASVSQMGARNVGKLPPPATSLIQMRKGKDDTGFKPITKFEHTEETDRWKSDLDRYNWFAEGHDIYLNMDVRRADAAVVACFSRKRDEGERQRPGITQPEYFDRYLRRIFNDSTFDHGGRLYGVWYQRLPGWLRAKIAIDGEPTVELDFSGMSVRMIYHLNRLPYLDDPYSIPELEAAAIRQGHEKVHYRGSVKKLVHAMLNNEDDDKRPEMVTLEQSFPRGFTRTKVRDLILAKHEPIRGAFGEGLGKKLHRLDSDIAFDVILKLMDRGILCLPIHDSFIVERSHKDTLYQQMIDSYRQQLPFSPLIKEVGKE
jgi:hypothetical protein